MPPPVVADPTPVDSFDEPPPAPVVVPQSSASPVYLPLIVRPDPYPPVDRAAELEFIRLLNEERARHGLHPLREDPRLTLAARRHAYDLGINLCPNGRYGHTGSDGSLPSDRAKWAGYPNAWAEVVICAHPHGAAGALQAFLNSPSHRAILLDPRPNTVDVGVGAYPSTWYGNPGTVFVGFTGAK
ncbi:MAG: CAP domain-containing protein [Roseiflexus sp.]